jgi:beta-glucosidase
VQPVIAPRGFRDVYLEAGKSANVTFDIGADELSIVNAEMKRVVEPGTVGILTGANSVDTASARLTILP